MRSALAEGERAPVIDPVCITQPRALSSPGSTGEHGRAGDEARPKRTSYAPPVPEVAPVLGLAETTVKSHLSSTFRKLGVRSRSEAAALVLDAQSGLGLGVLTISDGGEG